MGLFDSSQKSYTIPVYQRAYSWEKEQWKTFLIDLKEQLQGDNRYYYGNLLLEIIRKDREYEVIDGQQRLTTLTIFLRSLIDVINLKCDMGEITSLNLEDKRKIYLKNNGNIKLRPVDYDRVCYDTLIIEGKSFPNATTPSQKRIIEAKDYFEQELAKESMSTLEKIIDKLESAEVNCIELEGKKDSALMFELENNRGKDLTNLEKLKSHFMYQVYINSSKEDTESNIEYISNVFKSIYQFTNDIKQLNEDSILIYHCNAYLISGFSYRGIDDVKLEISKNGDADHKVKWIKVFADELYTTFSNIKRLERSEDPFIRRIFMMGAPAFIYPFLIKGMKHTNNDNQKLSKLFNLMEITVFRFKLINSRADLPSRLNSALKNFNGDLDWLKNELKLTLNSAGYWSDYRIKEYLNGYLGDTKLISYLLWVYESSIQNKGYQILKIADEQIEHISPQIPNGAGISAGYEVDEKNNYSQEFIDKYLYCLGNLMLISGSHNASIGNRPFNTKLISYNKNPWLNQQAEIKNFISGTIDQPRWDSESIKKRHKKIVEFAVSQWAYDSIHI